MILIFAFYSILISRAVLCILSRVKVVIMVRGGESNWRTTFRNIDRIVLSDVNVFPLFWIFCWSKWCWWWRYVGDMMLVTWCWCPSQYDGQIFETSVLVVVTKMSNKNINISNLSPIFSVSNIRHQHQWSHMFYNNL